MTTLARRPAPLFLNVNSNQNATYCFLQQSKRATSRIVVVGNDETVLIELSIAGDKAILDRNWAHVAAREHIAREIQTICEEKTNQDNIHEGTLHEEQR
jgi:hypothetical protein